MCGRQKDWNGNTCKRVFVSFYWSQRGKQCERGKRDINESEINNINRASTKPAYRQVICWNFICLLLYQKWRHIINVPWNYNRHLQIIISKNCYYFLRLILGMKSPCIRFTVFNIGRNLAAAVRLRHCHYDIISIFSHK